MGRLMGIEPMHAGATIQCVNRFTKAAVIIFCKRTREPRDSRVPLRQLPTLPRRLQRSTLGLRTLNCCVRNGNRWNRPGIITALLSVVHSKLDRRNSLQISCEITCDHGKRAALSYHKSSPRPISTGQLHALPHFYAQPIYLVFCKGSYSLKR